MSGRNPAEPASEPFAGFDAVGGRPGGPGPGARLHTGPRQWARDLAMGARFAAGGGREGWIRTALTAIGVGLGVAVLLLAAAVPAMLAARDDRGAARSTGGPMPHTATASTFLMRERTTTWHGQNVTGVLFRPDGPAMKPPPGVARLPRAGQMAVSPALRKLLDSEPLLRPRIPYRAAGTISDSGLVSPQELYYYANVDTLHEAHTDGGSAYRVAGFGYQADHDAPSPVLVLLLVVVVVVLLMPIAVFVAAAVRLGGERRDRRMAALRLVGCDIGGTHRIAAGEGLFGTLLGVLLGGAFFLIGRQLAADFTIQGQSAFPSDLAPDTALTVLITLAVPSAAVAVTLLSMRRTVVEPLGVFRQNAGRRRRVWWRVALPALGLALLVPLFGQVRGNGQVNQDQTAAGAVLLLIGVTALLPWAVEAVVRRLRGGPVPWQLATRRLQLDGGSVGRMAGGVTVAVAGAIALQMLFHAVDGDFVTDTGADPARAQVQVESRSTGYAETAQEIRDLAAAKGVAQVTGYTSSWASRADVAESDSASQMVPVMITDCASMRRLAAVGDCGPDTVYMVQQPGTDGGPSPSAPITAGLRLDFNTDRISDDGGPPSPWTVPAGARSVPAASSPAGGFFWGILATPDAIDGDLLKDRQMTALVRLDEHTPDAVEYVRTAAAGFGLDTYVLDIDSTSESAGYFRLRQGLFVGATLTLGLIGASLLVSMLEQLRDRRKLLAVLVAFGTRRSALAWSVLWQTAVPVVLGLLLAAAGGVGLGAALLAMTARPFTMDWGTVGALTGIGAAVVLGVTLLSMPVLWRLMRADGLRTE